MISSITEAYHWRKHGGKNLHRQKERLEEKKTGLAKKFPLRMPY